MFALLLIPAAMWPTLYFWVQTAPGQAQLTSAVADRFAEGLLAVEGIGWGPAPGALWLRGVVIRDAVAQPVITAETASLEVDLAATWTTGLTIRSAVARGFEVHLAWDGGGHFNLDRPWRRPRPRPREPKPPRPPPLVAIGGIDLQSGVVTLSWPTWNMRFEAVTTAGHVHAGGPEGLVIAADLSGATATATVRDRLLRFDAHAIDGFLWREGGFRTAGVTLTGASGAHVVASGEMNFSVGLAMNAVGAVSLPPVAEGALLAPWLPDGVSIDRLTVERTGLGPWSVDVSAASVPNLRLEPMNVAGLKTSFKGEFGSGTLLPRIAVRTRDVSAETVAVTESIHAESLTIGGLDVDVGASVDARLEGLQLSSLTMDGHAVSDLNLDGTVAVNVGGGAVDVTLKSGAGAVSVTGPVETSLLRRRADATLQVAFDEVGGGLGAWVRPLLPEAERPSEATSMSGKVTGRLGLRPSGPPSWSWTSFQWVEGAP